VILTLKLVLVPALLALASFASRRFGHAAGGWVAALPIVAGPIVLIMTLEQGRSFGAHAAGATLLGLVYVALFCLIYAHASRRFGWLLCVSAAWVQVAISTWVLSRVELSLPASFVLVLLTLALCYRALPDAGESGDSVPAYREIAWRMLAGVAMVLVTTSLAAWLGSRLSGLVAGFPIGVTVMAVFSQRFHGPPAVIHLLRALLPGLASFAVFFVVCALALRDLGTWPAFGLACLVSLALHAVLVWGMSRLARRTGTAPA
jgi:hypothetical protein